jgi:hypothetical protein
VLTVQLGPPEVFSTPEAGLGASELSKKLSVMVAPVGSAPTKPAATPVALMLVTVPEVRPVPAVSGNTFGPVLLRASAVVPDPSEPGDPSVAVTGMPTIAVQEVPVNERVGGVAVVSIVPLEAVDVNVPATVPAA